MFDTGPSLNDYALFQGYRPDGHRGGLQQAVRLTGDM